jgi:gamma-glutamylcyclotransferase (GGCT)/AIG2-like uncharacterized protein YtfP
MFLNGTAMSGQKDHGAIDGATFLGEVRTAPGYRFFAVRDEFPGLLPVTVDGRSILGELYEMTEELLLDGLMPQEPRELELGEITLEDGSTVNAMHLIPSRITPGDKYVDIADLGGFRAYQAFLAANERAKDVLGI